MIFFTGSDTSPPLGFEPLPTLAFHTDSLPTASTCINQLVLPLHNCYEDFKKHMLIGLKYHGGFGLQ